MYRLSALIPDAVAVLGVVVVVVVVVVVSMSGSYGLKSVAFSCISSVSVSVSGREHYRITTVSQ